MAWHSNNEQLAQFTQKESTMGGPWRTQNLKLSFKLFKGTRLQLFEWQSNILRGKLAYTRGYQLGKLENMSWSLLSSLEIGGVGSASSFTEAQTLQAQGVEDSLMQVIYGLNP